MFRGNGSPKVAATLRNQILSSTNTEQAKSIRTLMTQSNMLSRPAAQEVESVETGDAELIACEEFVCGNSSKCGE